MNRKELRAIKEAELTYEKAHRDFIYEPLTGRFFRRDTGAEIAKPQNSEYNYAEIRWAENGKLYQAHRVAWLMAKGSWPKGVVDHENNNHGDNRLSNLRDCTHAQNIANQRRKKTSKSGVKGVYWDSCRGKWHAQIVKSVGGRKSKTLGRFDTIEEAANAYAQAATEMFGEFARLS